MKLNKKKIIIAIIAVLIIVITSVAIYFISSKNTENISQNQNIQENEIPIQTIEENEESKEQENQINETISQQQSWQWQHQLPENHNISQTAIENLHNELNGQPINASVIVKDGFIVDEYYKSGYNEESIFSIQSCSKSITGALVGIAIEKGYIESIDTPIQNYFPQIQESNNQNLKQVTIRHLLTNTSSITNTDSNLWTQWRNSENWVDFLLNGTSSTPGTTFTYSTGNTHLLSAILQKATGKTAYEFGKEYLFEPVGMDSVQCGSDPQGISDGGNGFSMNVYDMARFGQLYLNNGNWEGQQIISTQWVQESTSVQFNRPTGSAEYGFQWWVRTFGSQRYNAYFAQGHGGQFIFVVPEINLIMVFTSNYSGNSNIYWQYVNDIVNNITNNT